MGILQTTLCANAQTALRITALLADMDLWSMPPLASARELRDVWSSVTKVRQSTWRHVAVWLHRLVLPNNLNAMKGTSLVKKPVLVSRSNRTKIWRIKGVKVQEMELRDLKANPKPTTMHVQTTLAVNTKTDVNEATSRFKAKIKWVTY